MDRLINWFSVEPSVSMLMVTTAIVLFGATFRAAREKSTHFWPWIRRIIEACVSAVLFIGLLWAFRAILNDNVNTFFATHGSLSDASRSSAYTIWGSPQSQVELTVEHSHEIEVKEEIPRNDPEKEPVYRTVKKVVTVPQNSLVGFVGDAKMRLSEREKGYALYSGYIVDVNLNYDVLNDSEFDTDANFTFPLSQGQTLFENFIIRVDDQDMSQDLRFSRDTVSWNTKMKAHQQNKVSISYSSRGMDYFIYQIPVQREIKNFVFTLSVDRLPVSLLNYPDGSMTPTEIKPTADGKGSILTWKLDRAITMAGMGVALLQPEQPGAQVLRVLVISPYALSLLVAMLALTLLIWGLEVRFIDLALLSAVYTMQFLLMSALSDVFFGFWGSLVVGMLLTLLLTYFLFRKLPSKALRWIVYGLVGFFTIIYPLSGLITELSQQNAFSMLLQAGLIIYITLLSLYVRQRSVAEPETNPEA